MNVRDITNSDIQQILRLNEESVNYLSPLDAQKLSKLITQAKYYKLIIIENKVVAFILAFDQDADYDSPNYQWFKTRYNSFLYIDRIVVSIEYRRMGLADSIYNDIIAFANNCLYEYLTCEIDILPPNPGSIRFHDKHKFVEIGTQWLYNKEKQVSLRERKISRENN